MVSITKSLVISWCDKEWCVKGEFLKEVNGKDWVKIHTSAATGLIKLIKGHSRRNMSLSGNTGIMDLQKARNLAQAVQLQAEKPSESLFSEDEKIKKKRKRTSYEMQEIREDPSEVDVELDGVIVKMLAAAHPQESLWIEAKNESIEAVLKKIKEHDADLEKREYSKGSDTIKIGGGRSAYKTAEGRFCSKKQ